MQSLTGFAHVSCSRLRGLNYVDPLLGIILHPVVPSEDGRKLMIGLVANATSDNPLCRQYKSLTRTRQRRRRENLPLANPLAPQYIVHVVNTDIL